VRFSEFCNLGFIQCSYEASASFSPRCGQEKKESLSDIINKQPINQGIVKKKTKNGRKERLHAKRKLG